MRLTPLGAIARGLLAGTAGTAAMDGFLFARYRQGGGESHLAARELSAGVSSWEDAPAPAQVGRRLVEGLFQVTLPPSRARLMNNVTHWAFGILGGASYGIAAGSLPAPRIRYGLPFGAAVWGSGYVVLPAAKLYEPIWKYDAATLAKDLSAHLAYGLGHGLRVPAAVAPVASSRYARGTPVRARVRRDAGGSNLGGVTQLRLRGDR